MQGIAQITTKAIDAISYKVIGAAIEVHRELGPGLLESVYHRCMMKELFERKIGFTSEPIVEIDYKGMSVDTQLRCDFFIEGCIALELKSVEVLAPVHEAQVMTYMRILRAPKGILINFNCINIFREGQKTFVNDIYKRLKESEH